MANITPRKNKKGEIISYRVRVSRGYDAQGHQMKPFETTFRPEPGLTKRQAEKALNEFVVTFEQQCRAGLAGDGKQKFSVYAEYVLDLKEKSGELRTHTLSRYRELLNRVNAGIGHLKICDIRPQHLNQFYEQLAKEGIRKNASKAVILPGVSLSDIIHAHGFSNVEKFLKEKAAISVGTYKQATREERISGGSARKIAAALEMDVSELFKLETDLRPLSPKTVREHHVLIHVILHHAEREMLIPYNPADKAQPPKVARTKADYFQQETVTAILQAAETEPLKWKTLLHHFYISQDLTAFQFQIC